MKRYNSAHHILSLFLLCSKIRNIAERSFPANQVDFMVWYDFPLIRKREPTNSAIKYSVASLVDYCPTAGKGSTMIYDAREKTETREYAFNFFPIHLDTVSVWSIPKQWVGREGCPSKIRDLTDPIIAARCAAQVLKAVGPDAWGSIGSKCKKQSPVWYVRCFFFF